MKKKNRHISKFLSGHLPEPEIRADDAWTQMHDMLDQTPVGKTGGFEKVLRLKWIFASLFVAAVSTLVILKFWNKEVGIVSSTSKQTIRTAEQKPTSSGITGTKNDSIRNESQQTQAESEISILNNYKNETRKSDKIEFPISQTKISASEKPLINPRVRHKIAANAEVNQKNNKQLSYENLGANSKSSKSHLSNYTPQKETANAAPASSQKPVILENHSYSFSILNSKGTKFKSNFLSLQNLIKAPRIPEISERVNKKSRSFHVGLEWNLNTPLGRTDYLFSRNDSISRPALLLIPGLVISKKWREHQLTLSIAANQSYFGNNERIAQRVDSTFGDSSLYYHNTNFIKATAVNFSLQYHYQVYGPLSVGFGGSYNIFSGMLARQQGENTNGEILDGPLLILKGREEMKPYLKPGNLSLKAGLLYNPGRFQAGFNIILPASNISSSPKYPVRNLNGQLFLRFFVW